jgi:cell division protease FtsH
LGPRTFGDKQELVFLGREISEQRDYGEKIANAIDQEVNHIIREAHDRATKILTENKSKLIQIAQKLIVDETIEAEKLEALFNQPVGVPVPEPAVASAAAPGEAAGQTAPQPKPKKSPTILPPLPNQAPATSD